MKAMIWTAYGPPEVLQPGEVPRPEPKENELLVRVRGASVTAGDCEMRSLSLAPFLQIPLRAYVGLLRPTRVRILGQEFAGEVAAVGAAVSRFQVGDPVFAATGFTFGAYAEYITLPEGAGISVVAIKPANLTFEEAAVVPVAGLEALHFMRVSELQTGQHILINGAGGSIGTYALQIAKHMGAEVTAVDSGPKLAMLRSLGADHVLDYTQQDITRTGQTYDVIFDVIVRSGHDRYLPMLRPRGRLLLANPGPRQMLRRGQAARADGIKVVSQAAGRSAADLAALRELIEGGHIRPVIDRVYPLAQLAEAHRYAESGQKQGNIAITVD